MYRLLVVQYKHTSAHCSAPPGTFELIVPHCQEHSVAAKLIAQNFVPARHPLQAIQQGCAGSDFGKGRCSATWRTLGTGYTGKHGSAGLEAFGC
jgi:hypothetical protein